MRVLFYSLSFIFLLLLQNVFTQSIDRKNLKADVRVMTSDSLEGRAAGSVGQWKAAKFIVDRFQSMGLSSNLEKFNLNQTWWNEVYLRTGNKVLKNFDRMVLEGGMKLNEEVEKEVVFGGHGTREELDQISVKGKLVFVFVKNLRSYHELNVTLSRMGAFGLILANPENEKQFESIKTSFRDYVLQKRLSLQDTQKTKTIIPGMDTTRLINSILIPNHEIKSILGLPLKELEKLMTEGRINEAPSGKVKVKFERIENAVETANVIGMVKGTTDRTIVVSAHYDHLGRSGDGYFPGADDNASGVSALLALAGVFSKSFDLKYNIMFLATTAEEAGLLGSAYHVSRPGFDPASIVCDLNVDMISRIDDKHENGRYLYCMVVDASGALEAQIRKADDFYASCYFDYSLSNGPFGLFSRSDQFSFYRKGVPSAFFFSGLHQDYHKTTDTFDKIDFAALEDRVKQIAVLIELLEK